MKKVVSFLAVLAVTVFSSGLAWAAQIDTPKSAFATFDSVAIDFAVTLHEWTSATKTTDYGQHAAPASGSIDFVTSGVTLGVEDNQPVVSNVYLKIHSNLTQQPAGTFIYMYTNNKANDTETTAADSYNATYPSSVEADGYNGLVRKGQKAASAYAAGDYAVLQIRAFKIGDAALATYKENGPKDSGIAFPWDDQSGGTKILQDKDTSGFSIDGEVWQTVIGKSGIGYGNWVGYGVPYGGSENINFYDSGDVIIFFNANFKSVVAGNSYGTKSIKFVNMAE